MAVWLDALATAERNNQPAVLITLLTARGSTPREAGAKMVVSADSLAGTIGGGNLEYQCEAAARTLLAAGAEGPSTREFPLGPALGQCCGGHVTILFEVLRPPSLTIGLFGAGHVGRALVKLLADLPCRVSWIDSRSEALPANLPPNVTPLRVAEPDRAVARLSAGSLVLVMTHDHQLDFEIVAAALRRPDLGAVGLIGSATKRARFISRLTRLGIATDNLICPIGLPGIEGPGVDGKHPAVVAVSVAAQILQIQARSSIPPSSSRSDSHMAVIKRNCGDCICPPVTAQVSR